ncbi:aconitate hydratase AcnA [Vibrio nitrifigilis]|uniref:Aconitate hydratase n=1 Tax=Vibrio nitrifigilis TaxID=2789781 RepID=A0ABS0GI57_9VIBR|nr:aconitate hydratase AcnA [Vibrio nitrifigilis]MBF9002111.1 aconitate hydratase AcnA [Vibrio nitrifigilis]
MSLYSEDFINRFSWNGQLYHYVDLKHLCGEQLTQLPYVMRLLLENAARHLEGAERKRTITSILRWLEQQSSMDEIPFQPSRVLMHDTTSTPALVDMAAMRDALAEQDIDPTILNPLLQVDVSVDHSLAVEYYAQNDAATKNLSLEMHRNRERYQFLRWASEAFKNVRINPPGTGIMHTINLEQLATVVQTEKHNDISWVFPDMMLGTDSHTPMINGIGVLGWGVGGLEAQSVMFGIPTMLRIPDVVGVKLVGTLSPMVQATDIALKVTHELRKLGVTGEFVEFFGSGVSELTADDRCVIANMAPEYGATTGYFAIDQETLDYLKRTGRTNEQIELIQAYSQANGLWFSPEQTPFYTRQVEIDLATINFNVAGPKRPQDLLNVGDIPAVLREAVAVSETLDKSLPQFPIAIAAITSCTNTTNPQQLIAAGLLARNANRYGVKIPSWVKTSLAPGSPAAASYLQRVDLLSELSQLGFDIVGFGCTTCIGNSGPLPHIISTAQQAQTCQPVAVLSGNRNFPGRIHPDLYLGFLMSPAMVVAFAIAGDAEMNLTRDAIFTDNNGNAVYLQDIWPSREEVANYTQLALNANDFNRDFSNASHNLLWDNLDVQNSPLFPWDPNSNTLRRPPFVDSTIQSLLGRYTAFPLMSLGDDVTTDHISPASAIPSDSFIADYLVERGEDRNDLNVFASRRGNWQVMMRGTFYNKSLCNNLCLEAPVGHTLHIPSKAIEPIWSVAQKYKDAHQPTIIIAGERYGMGSSRDWAAKGQQLLNVHAVIAVSFERIHRSNLIGMGILPLVISRSTWLAMNIQPGDRLTICALAEHLSPRSSVEVTIQRVDNHVEEFQATAAVETQLETELLRQGGVFKFILQKFNNSAESNLS